MALETNAGRIPSDDARIDEGDKRRSQTDGAFSFDPADGRPILVVLHQETSTPGRIGQVLAAADVALDIRRPVLGDSLPESLDDHRGAIVFGGPPSANDSHDYIRREIDWLRVPLKEERPFLGICLGAQMLAKHLGAEVGPREDGSAEIGFYPLRPTEAGREFMPDWPHMVYQWHREGFDVPTGATLLAAGDLYRNQAFRYGSNAFAVQFHSELTLAMVHRWTTKGAHLLDMPGARPRKEHFSARGLHDWATRRWLAAFLPRVFGRETARADA